MSGVQPYRPDLRRLSRVAFPADSPPTLTVVIDTEEEFDWAGPFDPASTGTANIAHQHLAQALFREHGVVPTYVVTYPVATAPAAVAVLRGWADAGECEVGTHLHPWVTPPRFEAVPPRLSYAGNLPEALERDKLSALTGAIEASFGKRPSVFKAGRYGVGPATYASLRRLGYEVDVSLVPHTDFSDDGGPDFTAVPSHPLRDPSGLLCLPLSVGFAGALAGAGSALFPYLSGAVGRACHLPGVASRLGLLERLRLSPEGHSLADMLRQVRAGLHRGSRLFMLTYHSSSLLPGATPYVRDEADRAAFLGALGSFLSVFRTQFGGRMAGIAEVAAPLRQGAA